MKYTRKQNIFWKITSAISYRKTISLKWPKSFLLKTFRSHKIQLKNIKFDLNLNLNLNGWIIKNKIIIPFVSARWELQEYILLRKFGIPFLIVYDRQDRLGTWSLVSGTVRNSQEQSGTVRNGQERSERSGTVRNGQEQSGTIQALK